MSAASAVVTPECGLSTCGDGSRERAREQLSSPRLPGPARPYGGRPRRKTHISFAREETGEAFLFIYILITVFVFSLFSFGHFLLCIV